MDNFRDRGADRLPNRPYPALDTRQRRLGTAPCGGVVGYVGVGQDHIERLIVAKFVAGNAQNPWHGYPADHCNPADAPDEDVIKEWLENEVLPAAKISKIHGGKKCKL